MNSILHGLIFFEVHLEWGKKIGANIYTKGMRGVCWNSVSLCTMMNLVKHFLAIFHQHSNE